ncbi:MAG: arcB [Bacteroidetes bacterium]|nr:arcB [Bacteroidota bacterium]
MINKSPFFREPSAIIFSHPLVKPVETRFPHTPAHESRPAEPCADSAELVEIKADLQDYVRGLQQIMFFTTHQLRQPITNILGISSMLEEQELSQEELRTVSGYLTQSISRLDLFTKDLILFTDSLVNSKKR